MAEQSDARRPKTLAGFGAGSAVYSLAIAGEMLVAAGFARMDRSAGPPSASVLPPQQPQS